MLGKPVFWIVGFLALLISVLSGCKGITAINTPVVDATGPERTTSFLQDMSEGHSERWYISDYSFPSKHYRSGWNGDHVSFSPDGMRLEIDREPTEFQLFSGAEYQRRGEYGYGRYEVVMKPASGSGLVSSFFVYTGAHYGTPHDEIDIKLLGRDTTRLHISVFAADVVENFQPIELGFDAAEDFNLYAFEWTPERIIWFVNGKAVHSIARAADKMPSHPGLIMTNLWTGAEGQQAWHGEPTFADGAAAVYRCISFQEPGDDTPQCSDRQWRSPAG